jgi:hypothetical protein
MSSILPPTDRDVWVGPPTIRHFMFWEIERAGLREDVSTGLRALAQAWFDEYDDETDLPDWFEKALAFAEDSLGDLDVPTRCDTDDSTVE